MHMRTGKNYVKHKKSSGPFFLLFFKTKKINNKEDSSRVDISRWKDEIFVLNL